MREILSDLAHDLEVGVEGVKSTNLARNGVKIVRTDIGTGVVTQGITRRSGSYYAIDDTDIYKENTLIATISSLIEDYIKNKNNILVVGLGNDNYICDSLGTSSLEYINTNHTKKVYTIAPLVKSITGLPSIDVIKAISREIGADTLIAIDTLATSRINRLARSIQITNAGINPGAGVGNGTSEITRDSVGVDIVAIGLPLVISSRNLGYSGNLTYLAPSLIDEIVAKYSRIIGKGIDLAISRI